MPIEIEAKLKVDDLNAVRIKLKDRNAQLVGDFLEINTFYDREDRSLLTADQGLRIRSARNTATGQEEFIITFKGPRQHGVLKTRSEQELVVSNDKDAHALLKCLGFVVVLQFEKRRQTWKLDQCKVELDELPNIGSFVEIEGPREDQILRLREQLGLNDRALVKASYTALMMTHLQERGDTNRVVKFG